MNLYDTSFKFCGKHIFWFKIFVMNRREYSNIILANQDFKAFQDLLKYFTERYELSDARTKAVRYAILDNAEQALMEAVAGVLSLKNDSSWAGNYQQALTKEALSAVVMQRFWSVKAIDDELNLLAGVAT